jgi:hypothetical protein
LTNPEEVMEILEAARTPHISPQRRYGFRLGRSARTGTAGRWAEIRRRAARERESGATSASSPDSAALHHGSETIQMLPAWRAERRAFS